MGQRFAICLVLPVVCAALAALGGCPGVAVAAVPTQREERIPPVVVARAELSPATEEAFLRLYFSDAYLVETATRAPKPLTHIAENVSVVTAQQIRDMNAHTLGDVLKRVPGVYTYTFGNHFGATPLAHIQGSGEPNPYLLGHEERHVLVLLDGIPWSSETAGAFLDTIPVGPIERIEIVKGPASSAWGSSLGGVINVITKDAGSAGRPRGEVSGAYGERNAWDLRGEIAGGLGPAGYYLQGQRQSAEWDQPGSAGFEQGSVLAKARVALGEAVSLDLSAGQVDVETDAGRLASQFALAQSENRATFGRAGLDVRLGDDLDLRLEAYRFEQCLDQPAQEDGTFAPAGDLLIDQQNDEEHTGLQARAAWRRGVHTVVAGADYRHTELMTRTDSGDFFQSLGNPAHFSADANADRWGVYLNDSVDLGPVSLTPGLRYDDGSRTDPFWSPSVGATWSLGAVTVLRINAARGFAAPPLTYLRGGGIGLIPNPDLEPEEILSYQAGLETAAVPHFWLKATGFRHEVTHAIRVVADPLGATTANRGSVWRTGYELEGETDRLGGFAARGGFSYVKVEASGRDRDQNQHQALLGFYYDRGGFHAEAFGRYIWWDLGRGAEEGAHDDFLWDLNLRHALSLSRGVAAELFGSVHNLFAGDGQYDVDRGQEGRWVEAGVRVRF